MIAEKVKKGSLVKILILNGPNLNLLGQREPDIYGNMNLDGIIQKASNAAEELGFSVDAFQSNEEGELVSRIGESEGVYDGIVLNAAAYTHTSVALRDAISASPVPCVEVHISNIYSREDFRQKNLIAGVCLGQIAGFGPEVYVLAVKALASHMIASKGGK